MEVCVECGHEIEDREAACPQCGIPTRAGAPVLPFDAAESAEVFPPEDAGAEVQPVPGEALHHGFVARPRPEPAARRPALLLVAVTVLAGGVITLVILRAHSAPRPDDAAAGPSPGEAVTAVPDPGEPPPAQPVPVAHVETAPADVPRWSADNRATWLGPRSRGVVLEVAAENTVGVWMRNVRPSLVVRCTGGRTEVFVFTQSPARIEPGTEDHTVTVAIDDDDVITELWPDSVEHDSLFAPDGAALAKRLLGARSMRFGFTPHNAAPAVARFHVEGLDALLRPSVRECGWTGSSPR
jgi:hypothetical protein